MHIEEWKRERERENSGWKLQSFITQPWKGHSSTSAYAMGHTDQPRYNVRENYKNILVRGQDPYSIAIMKAKQANVGSSLIKSQGWNDSPWLSDLFSGHLVPLHGSSLLFFMKASPCWQLSCLLTLFPATRFGNPETPLFDFFLSLSVQAVSWFFCLSNFMYNAVGLPWILVESTSLDKNQTYKSPQEKTFPTTALPLKGCRVIYCAWFR